MERDGHLRWDLTRLHAEVLTGLAMVPDAESLGIDTWGVDYGLLDADGRLMAEPISYRDDRTAGLIDDVHATVPPERLYKITGLQFLPFNTIYQLAAERRGPYWPRATRASRSSRTFSPTGSRVSCAVRSPTPLPPGCSTSTP